MNGPFLKAISVADKSGFSGSGKNQFLSIELELDGFSFGIFDSRSLKPSIIESYTIQEGLSPGQFAAILHAFIVKSSFLLVPFEKVNLGWHHQHYTLVPEKLFFPSAKNKYHSLSANYSEGYLLSSDTLVKLGAYGIYPFPELLDHKLRIIYPNVKIIHQATLLIEKALKTFELVIDDFDIFLNIRSKKFEILIFDKRRLVFYNSFSHQTIDDLMYFIFYVLEQFRLDAGKINAIVTGEITENSTTFQYLSKYFQKVALPPSNAPVPFDDAFGQVPENVYHNLINLAKCEL